ncbi:MAG: amidohydrolase family protein [Sedimentisphaerales bacterium]|nr:amidohydrolase family protein [Sedimentisphaerales bacterium]
MSERIVDFHTHAFPDALAGRAMKALLDEAPGIRAYLDGTVGDLLHSMDRAGIERSVVCCIATKPEQYEPILRWCRDIRCERLIPFPSVHPADPEALARIRQVRSEGFLGLKLHPFYQSFYALEDRMLPYYDEVTRQNLLLVMHTGFDVAFPRERRADPQTLLDLTRAFPRLKLVATHLGAWQQWDEVRRCLLGQPIHIEISLAMEDLGPTVSREMLLGHPQEYLLFGTDAPWGDQQATLSLLQDLKLPSGRLSRMLSANADRLLGSVAE